MAEKELPAEQKLFGVVQKADGRLEICVYHLNPSALKAVKKQAEKPSSVLERLEVYPAPDPRTKSWFARMVCDNQARWLAQQGGPAATAHALTELEPPRPPFPALTTDDACASLSEMGFREVGAWSLDASMDSGVSFALYDMASDRAIYAFTSAGRLQYVGACLCGSATLWDCMRLYQSLSGNASEARIGRRIREHLAQAQPLAIRAWKPQTAPDAAASDIDLVRWLPQPLIQRLRPAWNLES